jgi:hypothetical protein
MCDGNAVFPINITKSNFNGVCKTDCKLEFLYAPSQCNCTNKDTYLSFSYDIYANKPVLFNSVYYDVSEVRIYSPSLHKYDGALCNGELVVLHIGTSGENLAICVPIIVNNGEFSTIDNIIDLASQSVQDYDQSATLNTDFNLSTLIPAVNHLYYRAITPFDCDTAFDICVFGNKISYIPIYTDQLRLLEGIISGTNYNTRDDIRYKISLANSKTEIRCIPLSSKENEGFTLINKQVENMEVKFEDFIDSKNRISLITLGSIAGGALVISIFLSSVLKSCKK